MPQRTMAGGSNRKTMVDALEATKESLGWDDFITMIRGHSADPVQRIENQKQKELRPFQPDWAAVRVGNDFAPKDLTNMLPGDTKISRSWSFNDQLDNQDLDAILDLGPNENPPWAAPLYQIFTYCVELKVRYGYVISDRELLVVRIRPMDVAHCKKDPPKRSGRYLQKEEQLGESNEETLKKRDIKNGILELASIRVGSQQEDVLTVNLALWWLHLLALKDNTVQRSYKDLADESLGRIGRRLEDETSTARAENGEDNDAGPGNEGEDDAVSEQSSDESDGPSHQEDPDNQMYFSFRADARLPTVAEAKSSSLGKRPRKSSSDSDSKKPRV